MAKKIYPEIELTIESIGFEGVSIARHEGKVHFIQGGIPGDIVLASIHKNKSKYAEGTIKKVLRPGEGRKHPVCGHFGICGGCKWQHLEYEEQLLWKKSHVIDAFQRIGKIPFSHVFETLPSQQILHYRNKMEFSFGASRWLTAGEMNDDTIHRSFAIGLHIPGRFDKVLDIDECHIADSRNKQILALIRAKAHEMGITAHHAREHHGFLRNLIMRTAQNGTQCMIVLITSPTSTIQEEQFIEWYQTEFSKQISSITSQVWAVTESKSGVAVGDIYWTKGQESITEIINGVTFTISPFSFFQTNAVQLEPFISTILSTAAINQTDIVWDLYCGAGSITLPAAHRCKQIIGCELSASSIQDANKNKVANSINNVEFYHEDLHKKNAIEKLMTFEKPDIIILDPPRAGIHEILLQHLLTLESPKIVYVSCNPATQARDCAILHEKYDVISLQPVDMFPHTYHVENIALLQLRNHNEHN